MPARVVHPHVGIDVVQRADVAPASAPRAVGPCASTRPCFSSTSSRQTRGRQIEVVRRDRDRDAARSRFRSRQRASRPRADTPRSSDAVGSSSSRMSDDCVSAAAMTTRCFSPPLSVLKRRSSRCRRAGGAQHLARNRQIARTLELEESADADDGPSTPSRARCTRRRAAFPAARPQSAARPRGGGADRADGRRAARGRTSAGACRSRDAAASSCRIRSVRGCRRARRAESSAILVEDGEAPGLVAVPTLPRRCGYANETLSACSKAHSG